MVITIIMGFSGCKELSGGCYDFFIAYVTPIITIVFFMNYVSIAKKLIKGQDVHNQAILNGLMFGFIIFLLFGLHF
jgi:hypothetical protein